MLPQVAQAYEKLNFLRTSVVSRNLRDLHVYKRLYGGRNRAENCEKLLLNFNKICLPEKWKIEQTVEL